jgi:hypothetical protein
MTTTETIIWALTVCYLGTIVLGLGLVKSGGKQKDPLLDHTVLVNTSPNEAAYRGKLQASSDREIVLVEAVALAEGRQTPIPGSFVIPRTRIDSIQGIAD